MSSAFYAIGFDMRGRRAVAGPFNSDTEAQDCKDQIPQIIEVKELPTRSLQRAKAILKLEQSRSSGSLDDGLQSMRGYQL